MTRTSANGWPVLTSPPPLVHVPGTNLSLRVCPGDVAVIFTELVRRFDNEVEDVDRVGHPADLADKAPSVSSGTGSKVADDWSWAVRTQRGSASAVSNHASGTAIDLNATQHPRGRRGTFTRSQVSAVRRILAAFVDSATGRSVIRWGQDYTTVVDAMHFEINAGPAAIKRVADRIRKNQTPVVPKPRPTIGDDMFLASVPGPDPRVFLVHGAGKTHVQNTAQLAELRRLGIPDKGNVSSATLSLFPDTSGVPAAVAALVTRLDTLAGQVRDDATAAQVAEIKALVEELLTPPAETEDPVPADPEP